MAFTPPPPYPASHGLLNGKTVLVTASAGTGLGYATAKRCAEEGATVMLSDMHEKRLTQYADKLEAEIGRKVHRQPCNVTEEADVQALIGAAVEGMGRLDVLVNNAGLGGTVDLVDMQDEQWLNIMNVNINGTFRMMRAALPVMMAQGAGNIVNLSSVVAWRASPGQSAYATSKAGVLAMTRAAAMEVAKQGVRINAVVPSIAMHPNLAKVTTPEFLEQVIDQYEAFGRAAEPWEIGNVVVFLASEYSSYMTGEAVSVSCRHP